MSFNESEQRTGFKQLAIKLWYKDSVVANAAFLWIVQHTGSSRYRILYINTILSHSEFTSKYIFFTMHNPPSVPT